MIIVGTAGKTLATLGVQGADIADLRHTIQQIQPEFYHFHLEHQHIQFNEENLLGLEIDGRFIPFSTHALKNLCKLLKVPASYVNKLISNDLTLKNINENPLRMGVEVGITIWKDDEDPESRFLAGFSLGSSLDSLSFLNMVESSGLMERNNLQIHQWAYLPEELVLHFLQKEVFESADPAFHYTYQLGISMHFGESSDQPFSIHPFYHVRYRLPNGEWMEWDFESRRNLGKANKKSRAFGGEVQKILSEFQIGTLSQDFVLMKTLIEASGGISEIKFKHLKAVAGMVKSIFTHPTLPDTAQFIKTDIFPELDHFVQSNREQMKEMEPFQIANLLVPVSLPLLFNRIYYSPLLLENPHFMTKSAPGIYKIMYLAAEEANPVVV